MKIQFRELRGKRFYNFSHRKLIDKKDAKTMLGKAKRYFPNRSFRLKLK